VLKICDIRFCREKFYDIYMDAKGKNVDKNYCDIHYDNSSFNGIIRMSAP